MVGFRSNSLVTSTGSFTRPSAWTTIWRVLCLDLALTGNSSMLIDFHLWNCQRVLHRLIFAGLVDDNFWVPYLTRRECHNHAMQVCHVCSWRRNQGLECGEGPFRLQSIRRRDTVERNVEQSCSGYWLNGVVLMREDEHLNAQATLQTSITLGIKKGIYHWSLRPVW